MASPIAKRPQAPMRPYTGPCSRDGALGRLRQTAVGCARCQAGQVGGVAALSACPLHYGRLTCCANGVGLWHTHTARSSHERVTEVSSELGAASDAAVAALRVEADGEQAVAADRRPRWLRLA